MMILGLDALALGKMSGCAKVLFRGMCVRSRVADALRQLGCGSLLAIMPACALIAQTQTPMKAKPNAIFNVSNKPPPGFAAASLIQTQETLVTIHFGGRVLLNARAVLKAETIHFLAPLNIVTKIPHLGAQNKAIILAALKKPLPLHQDLLCPKGTGKDSVACHVLKPRIVGVIIDPNRYQAALFINPKYLVAQKVQAFKLGPSNTGFSLLGRNNVIVSKDNNSQVYAYSNQFTAGYHNNYLTTHAIIQRSHNTGSAEQTQIRFDQLTLGRYQNGLFYDAGMLDSFAGDAFLTQQPILGVSLSNDRSIIEQNNDQLPGSPIQVYLAVPALVRVYRQGQIIYSQNLAAGKQYIDTSAFPPGAYNVTVEVLSGGAVTQKFTRFYLKQAGLPKIGKTNFHFSLGVLQKNNVSGASADNNFQLQSNTYSDVAVASAAQTFGISHHLAFSSAISSDFQLAYGSMSLHYYGGHFTLSPGIMASNNRYYGIGINGTYAGDSGMSLDTQVTKIFHHGVEKPDTRTGEAARYNNFNPLAYNNLQMYSALNYTHDKTTMSLTSNISRAPGEGMFRDYGMSITQNLYNQQTSSATLSFSAEHYVGDNVFLLSLNLYFTTASWNGLLNVGYTNNQSNGSNGTGHWRPTVNAQLTHSSDWNYSDQATISGNYHYEHDLQYYALDAMYQSDLLQTDWSVTHNVPRNNTDTTSISGGLNSSFAYSNGHWGVGYSQGLSNGILVNVLAPSKTKSKVLVDGSPVAYATSNQPEAIFLLPYKSYKVQIVPEGNGLYHYDPEPKIATIYKGNVKYLQWTLRRQFIVFATVHQPNGKPLQDALVDHTHLFESTDESGMIQLSIETGQHVVDFKTLSNQRCRVSLPKGLKPQKGESFIQLNKPLICYPHYGAQGR